MRVDLGRIHCGDHISRKGKMQGLMGRDAAEGRLQECESNVKETFEGYERAGIY